MDEDHNCPIHRRPCVNRKEENYFFRLSRYQQQIEVGRRHCGRRLAACPAACPDKPLKPSFPTLYQLVKASWQLMRTGRREASRYLQLRHPERRGLHVKNSDDPASSHPAAGHGLMSGSAVRRSC